MSGSAFDWSIIGPAWLAGLLVLVTHVPLGVRVLQRGIVFIDLAIAQMAGLGVIAAIALGMPPDGFGVQFAALGAAVLGALLFQRVERRAREQQEALIGMTFVLAACAGILLLSGTPHAGEHLQELLVGQILWVGWSELAWLAVVTALVAAVWYWGLPGRLERIGFYLAFAIAVTTSVQLIGVYLVFASLIVPALATLNHSGTLRCTVAYGLGAVGYVVGLVLSALFDLPSGAAIVWALAACGVVVWSMGRKLDTNMRA